ncbi:xylosidase [Planctomycetales bacterium ZRK34]|nr:xylosidase [Planctomycetales bacterium ZRK34]
MIRCSWFAIVLLLATPLLGAEHHVAQDGDDAHDGSAARPLRTISEAARRAQPGDVITVHEGIYRERIDPPRGGTSDDRRIVYQAAPGQNVVIKGSEIVRGWKKVAHDTWQVTLPNTFFGEFNPYNDPIRGDWFNPRGRVHHTGAVYLNGHWLIEAAKQEEVLQPVQGEPRWFATVADGVTTIWAQLPSVDPNRDGIEINVRRCVFYPSKPGINYITVRGFTLEHAATPWAPPTAEQIGLIGTHWSRGWIIERNTIRYSICTGITLGKHGDAFDNTSQDTAEGYVKTIERAHAFAIPWTRQNIGHHIVRDNYIAYCEQAGIVGSMGAVFSTITDNTIHDIHVRSLFTGAEVAGIKFHGAIDSLIARNHIYKTIRGIWLDWMTQGTRVTANLLHDNGPAEDLFVEVNHGPFMVDHNLFLSTRSLLEASGGGAYAHNLFTGDIRPRNETRLTPYHPAHATQVAGLAKIVSDDERFYNNLFIAHADLSQYGSDATHLRAAGNVYLHGAKPPANESNPLVLPSFDAGLKLESRDDGAYLHVRLDPQWAVQTKSPQVTTELLGRAVVPDLPFTQADGSPYRLDVDYFGHTRDAKAPLPGPFARDQTGGDWIKLWPIPH